MNQFLHPPDSPAAIAHNECPSCVFKSLTIPSYSFAALKSLHSSNPTNKSIRAIQRTLEETSATLRHQIATHKSILARMEDAQAAVDATLHNISLILAPIPFLPDDILSAIFHWCIPYPHPPAKSTVVDSLCATQPPWSLSYVCSRWRSLVLSSPPLWSTLSIPLDYRSHLPYEKGSWRLALFLERSGMTQLDVVLQEHDRYQLHFEDPDEEYSGHPVDSEPRKIFLRLLHPTTPRWRRLELDVEETHFDELADCSFPSLRHLIFRDHGDYPTFPFVQHRDMDGVVKLTMRSSVETSESMDPVWGNIRVATFCSWLLGLLPQMAQLEVLHVDNAFLLELPEYSPVSCFLPNLHTIAFLSGNRIFDIDYVLSELVTPALRTLELRFHEKSEWDPDDELKCDQLHYLSSLYIDISGAPCNKTILVLFSRTVLVTTLFLGLNNATQTVLDALRGRLLPNLTSLRLDFSTLRKEPEKVVSMMEARCDGIRMAALEDVTFVRSGKDAWCTAESLSRIASSRWAALRRKIVVRYVEAELRVL